MKNKTKGVILMIFSSLCFALMAAAVKSVPEISISQKMFFRNSVTLVVASVMILKKKKSFVGKNKKGLLMRSILGLLGIAGNYYAISKLPLAESEILNKTSSFFVIILAGIFLKEKITRKQIYAIILAFVGALFVIKPRLDFSILPALIGLSGAFFAGAAYTMVRYLNRTDSPDTIVFYFGLISTLAVIPMMLLDGFVLSGVPQLLKLLSVGIFAAAAQIFMAYAYSFASASELSIYLFINIVFSLLIGFAIWGELPDIFSLFGGLVIILSGYINYRLNIRENGLSQRIL
ncbi:EamA domain-containing membrane protein RarD [Proteiniborus ethanoligenes]|uniref:EamA domain-containing membrane protein RarD n=1 Tax=Proteiniborus ethanoligenes TaxID=415015 RepID=A0A1H3RX37_9FIRM|nr:DMT family transporter [Proteiniborus ethanoligenes]SDZ30303.1 EamA domain-containing membrane protein RarD [Proteiniborus ethanoligenes]